VRGKGYKHIVGAEVRGEGPYALLAAIVLQACADLHPAPNVRESNPGLPEAARAWLHSPACAEVLDLLNIPYQPFLEALNDYQLRRGTSCRARWQRRDVA
jgi:hypothetical protein